MNSLNSNTVSATSFFNANTIKKYNMNKYSSLNYNNIDKFKKFNLHDSNEITDDIYIKKTYLILISFIALIIVKKSIYH